MTRNTPEPTKDSPFITMTAAPGVTLPAGSQTTLIGIDGLARITNATISRIG